MLKTTAALALLGFANADYNHATNYYYDYTNGSGSAYWKETVTIKPTYGYGRAEVTDAYTTGY
jgi:hypothetical protein